METIPFIRWSTPHIIALVLTVIVAVLLLWLGSRLQERGFARVWYVDSGMDGESRERCRRLSESGRFPPILTVEEFSKVLHFLSE